MPVRITLTFWGDVQLDRTLERFELAAVDARPAWAEIHRRFLKLEARQFRTEGAYSGGWPPLSPPYAAWKARHYPGKPILRRTDDLWRSLTDPGAGGHIYVAEPHLLIMGSSVAYGGRHQSGGANLPRRPPVDVPELERREWVRVLQRFLVTGTPTA